jgi:hypothetical protein
MDEGNSFWEINGYTQVKKRAQKKITSFDKVIELKNLGKF